MSHYLQLSHDPILFDPVSLVTNVFFDGTNNQVFAVRSGGETGVIVKGPTSKNHLTFQMKDLGPLISIKFSIGQKVLALQRKETSVEFSNFINGETDPIDYSQTCKGRTNKILTFHWVAADEIIFSTEQGIEYYQVNMEKRLLKLIKHHNIQTNWSVYSPTSSVLLVSTSNNANTLLPFHFKNGQVTKLQKFVVDFPQTTTQPNQQLLLERDVTLLSIYNTLYAAVLRHPTINSPEKCLLVLYIVHRDIPVRKSFILRLGDIGKFAFNVVDNLVIAHHQFSKKSIIFDIKLPGISKSNIIYLDPLVPPCSIKPYFLQNKDFPSQSPAENNETECNLYATTWIVFQPNIIIDAALGCMWYVGIMLDDISSFFKEQSLFLDFLLLRKQSKPAIIKLCLKGLKNQLSLNQVSTMFSKLNQVYKAYIEAEESFQLRAVEVQSRIVPHHRTLIVLDQNDLFTYILQPFIEDKQINNYYKISVLIDYLKALDSFKINVQIFINKLLINALIEAERYFQLYQLLHHNIIQDSKEVASLLLELESKDKQCFQLGLDMLKRIATSDNEVIEILLSKKLILPSLRFIRSVGMLDLVPARKFLKASMFDDMLFYSVYKLFEARNLRINGKVEFKPVNCNTRRMFVDLTDGNSQSRQISNPSVIIRVTANNQINVGAQIHDAVLPAGSYCAFFEGTTAAENLKVNYTASIDNAKFITFPNKRVYAVCNGPLPIFAKFNFIPYSHDCSGSHLNNSIHFYNLLYTANFFNTSSAPTGENLLCEIEVDGFDGYFVFSDNSASPDTIQIEDAQGNVFDSLVGTEGNNFYRINRAQPFTVQIISDASNHNGYTQSLFAVEYDCFVNESEPFIFYSPENCEKLAVQFHHAGGPWSARLYNTYLNDSQGECWMHDGNHADHGDVIGEFDSDIITSGYVSTTGEYMFLKCMAINGSLPVVGVYAVYATVEDCGSYDVSSDEIEISGSYENMTLCQWAAYPEYPYNGIHVEIEDFDRDDNLIIVGNNITNAALFSSDPEFDDMDSSFDVTGHVVYIQYYSPGDTEFEITISVKRKSEIRCEHHAEITVIHDDADLMTAFMGKEMVVSDSYVLRVDQVPMHCRPVTQNHRYVSFHFNLSSCGVEISETIDDYIYNYTVRVLPKIKPNLPIYRHIDETLTFTCLFKKDALAEVNVMETMPTIFPYLMNTAQGLIEVSFQLYSDSDFQIKLHSGDSRIEATDFIYVDVTMKEFEGMTMRTARCWATPTYNETVDTPEYNIIVDECPADNDEDGASGIQVLVNDKPASFQFQFCSFQWFNVTEEEQKIFLHCEVNFCDDDGNMCEPKACSPNRNARDVHDDYLRSRELMKETHVITQGPIFVTSKKDDPCRGNVCSDICTLNLEDQPVCSCLNRRALLDDGVTCVDFEDVEFLLNSTNFENTILIALVLSALVMFGALIARCYS